MIRKISTIDFFQNLVERDTLSFKDCKNLYNGQAKRKDPHAFIEARQLILLLLQPSLGTTLSIGTGIFLPSQFRLFIENYHVYNLMILLARCTEK